MHQRISRACRNRSVNYLPNPASPQRRRVMETKLLSHARVRLAGACVLAAVLSQAAYAASPADSSQPVQSVWKPVEIKYSYVGFTTAYNCDSFESKEIGRASCRERG